MRQFITTIALLLFSAPLFAIGLGDIDLKSRLNQRFDAQIAIIVDDKTDAGDINVRLANIAHFKRAGIDRSIVAISLTFEPRRTDNGQMVIQVGSKGRILEPMIGFIVEIEHRGSRSLREYTAFLGLPDS